MGNTGSIYINGVIGNVEGLAEGEDYVELVDVVAQVTMQPEATEYNLYITSPGGYTKEGYDIYDYLKSIGKPINSIGQGIVASIATVIFMAGAKRVLLPNTAFMVHLPSGGVEGTSEQIQDYASYIAEEEKKIIKFYSDNTTLSKEVLKPLLSNETWLDTKKAFELGFSTVEPKEQKAVAYFKQKKQEMSKQEEKKILSAEDKKFFVGFFEKFGNFFGSQAKNIIIQDANGADIDFLEVEEGQSVAVGDKATVDGVEAEGEYTLPSGEVYVFASGELTEIKPVEEGEEGEDSEALKEALDQIALLETEKETLTKEVENAVNKTKEVEAKLTKLGERV